METRHVWVSREGNLGRNCIRGTDVTVAELVMDLLAGMPLAEIAREFGVSEDACRGAVEDLADEMSDWHCPECGGEEYSCEYDNVAPGRVVMRCLDCRRGWETENEYWTLDTTMCGT